MAELIVVDDEPDLRAMLAEYLTLAGHRVRPAADGVELRRLLGEASTDLVVLDVGLPGEDGFRLARWLREHHDPGIVMLTGADTTDRPGRRPRGRSRRLCRQAVRPRRTCARGSTSVLRRRRPRAKPAALPEGILPFGPYRFDTRRFRLTRADWRGGAAWPPWSSTWSRRSSTHPGRALGREDLLRLAPARDDESFDRSIDNRITRLRRKLERDPAKPELIKTVRGAGYLYPG